MSQSSSDDDDEDEFLGFDNINFPSLPSTSDEAKCAYANCSGSAKEMLQCFDCDGKFHYNCVNIPASTYKCIAESVKVGVRWHCLSCLNLCSEGSPLQNNFVNFKKSISKDLKAFSENVEQKLKEFKGQILNNQESCQKTYAAKVSKALGKQQTQYQSKTKL